MRSILLALFLHAAFSGSAGAAPSDSPADVGGRGGRALVPTSPPPVHNAWAVVIGVSNYASAGIQDLQFADDDASAFAAQLQEGSFGGRGIAPERMRLLVEGDATGQRVREALLDFLGKAGRDDLVVIFFAGHGLPDPSRQDELYLLVQDTDPERLASTGIRMSDLQDAVERIKAERVVLFVDACHSGGIAAPGIRYRSAPEVNLVNRFLADLAKSGRNRVVVTSSDSNERSMESAKWGQHGVFTWALLRALRGEADVNKDEIVQLGETCDFVRDEVEKATDGKQHPLVRTGDNYDSRLPLAIARSGAPASSAPIKPFTAPKPSGKIDPRHTLDPFQNHDKASGAPTVPGKSRLRIQVEGRGALGERVLDPGEKGRVTVGRDPANDLVLDDRICGKRHLMFVFDEGRWTVVDNGSPNGTFLNGERVSSAPVRAGDVVTLGATRIQITALD